MIDLNSDFGRAVRQHLEQDYVIWLTTVDSKLTPQPRPVWFVWQADSFVIFSQPQAHKVRHIRAHPRVALHFNTDQTGDRHVIVFEGEARIDAETPPAHEVAPYLEKYREGVAALGMTPQGFSSEYSTAIKITPSRVRGWE